MALWISMNGSMDFFTQFYGFPLVAMWNFMHGSADFHKRFCGLSCRNLHENRAPTHVKSTENFYDYYKAYTVSTF